MNCNKFKMKTKIYERGKKKKKCVFPILNHLRAASTRLEATLMALAPIAWEYANHKGEGGRNKRERVFTRLRIISTVLKSVPILDLIKYIIINEVFHYRKEKKETLLILSQ